MSPLTAKKKSSVDRFWDRFIDQAQKNGVKQPALRWHVHHAEAYLKAFPDKRLASHDLQDVTGYLEKLGRLDRIADWQFVQIVNAVENLLITAGAAVASEVDWGYWRDSGRTLDDQHPTIARETRESPSPPGKHPAAPPRTKPLESKSSYCSARSELDQVRAQHRSLLQRLIAEIRRRHYSIRTEQSYEAWVCRFILFPD